MYSCLIIISSIDVKTLKPNRDFFLPGPDLSAFLVAGYARCNICGLFFKGLGFSIASELFLE